MAEGQTYHPRAIAAAWTIIAIGAVAAAWSVAAGPKLNAALPPLGIRLVAPKSFLADSSASVRVIVTDHAKRAPAAGAVVSIRLTNDEGTQGTVLFEGKANSAGTVDARFDVPAWQPGDYVLRVDARYGPLSDEAALPVRLRRDYNIMLVTDKPLYQPGQTIHMRALVLRRPHLKPDAGQQVILEVRDSKGNKVFKRKLTTNKFGAAWADFSLADELNLGRYECRAIVADVQAVKTVTVKRYVLPKFKVTVTTARPYYLPGMELSGSVSAQYFFGKPVSGGKVEVVAKTFDVEYNTVATVTGRTDADGNFDFSLRLPRHFVGQPLQQGKAFVELEVKVTDRADHTEKVVLNRPVAAADLQVHAVPESGKLVPNLPNRVWVLVSDPTGKPRQATVTLTGVDASRPWSVKWARQTVETDEIGIAQFQMVPSVELPKMAAVGRLGELVPDLDVLVPRARKVMPGAPRGPTSAVVIHVAAWTRDGAKTSADISLPAGKPTGAETILLRTDRALARVGETIRAAALTQARTGWVYFDVVKDRQTMLTRAARIRNGRAEFEFAPDPMLAGTIYLSAYRITRRGDIIRDTRPLIVQPAEGLRIRVRAGKDVYRPGDPARIHFEVRSSDGQPVVAALGVSIVDESVFALQEMQPGMERVYAYLEQELRKPRYEIHGLELPVIVASERPRLDATRQRAAQFMLASVELAAPDMETIDTYAKRLEEAKKRWAKKMQPKLNVIARAMQAYRRKHRRAPSVKEGLDALVREGFVKSDDILDLWGNRLRAIPPWPGQDDLSEFMVISAGPDGEFGTADDVLVGTQPMVDVVRFFERGPVRALGVGAAMPAAEMAKAGGPPPAAAAPGRAGAGAKPVRIRQFFPETLLFRPDLITNDRGRASLQFTMADSITTWRMTALANSAAGELGSKDAPIRCFQDFFVDIDLPVSLTQGDEIAIPVAVYNYLKSAQQVRLKMAAAGWFDLMDDAEQVVSLQPNEVTVRRFRIRVKTLGSHKLTVFAYGSKMSDAIKRTVRVVPDGKMMQQTASGRLKDQTVAEVTIPDNAIDGASTILVKIYPGIFSQAVEGLDSILRMPFGCFEQTTSVTYPNVLVLDYMQTTRQVTPEIQMKAEGFINHGYQRLLSYEVQGGGFSWFGNPPASKMLTALGLMEFYDMAQVFAVDEDVITRTQRWLLAQQNEDGSWSPDEEYLHQETWRRIQNKTLAPTAYVTWALLSTRESSPKTKAGWEYVRSHWKEAEGPYQLALACNALVAGDNLFNNGDLDDTTIQALDRLISMAQRKDDQMWWESKMTGLTHSRGRGADLEATGLAAIALISSGVHAPEATQVLNYLIANKDPGGTWYSTQATMLALKALLLAQKGATAKSEGTVRIIVNGKEAAAFKITPDNNDVLQMADCRDFVRRGRNTVKILFEGKGSMLYQVVGKYWLPWKAVRRPAKQLLEISIDYDKRHLTVDDTVTATVRIKNNSPARTSMVVVDLGIPPGFTVDAGDLAELVDQGVIDKFNLTSRQIIVYLERLDAGQLIEFQYRLKARFPIRAKAPSSSAYEYYNPDNRAETASVEMVVTR